MLKLKMMRYRDGRTFRQIRQVCIKAVINRCEVHRLRRG